MNPDAIIIGGGLHGSSAAFQLASRGVSVLVIERDHVARHASGASAGGVRRVRRHRAELPLAMESLALWRRLPELIGSDCGFDACGHLLLAESEADLAWIDERVALTHGLGYRFEERVGAEELRRMIPALAGGILGGILARDDGYANPLITTAAFRDKAVALGAAYLEGTEVLDLGRGSAGWEVATSAGRHSARHLVNCAGGWGAKIAAMAGEVIPLQVKANTMTVTARVPRFLGPVVGHVRKRLSLKQMQNGTVVIGGGYMGRADPDTGASDVLFGNLPPNMQPVIDAFPHLARAPIVRCWTGLEAYTPDAIPVLGTSAESPGLVHSFGYSGHGFQLGPICGVIVADLVAQGGTDLPIAPFRPGRFDAGVPVTWGGSEGTAAEETVPPTRPAAKEQARTQPG